MLSWKMVPHISLLARIDCLTYLYSNNPMEHIDDEAQRRLPLTLGGERLSREMPPIVLLEDCRPTRV
jgi:hypothetical protein